MGRRSTNAETCEAAERIELSYLKKNGYIAKGKEVLHILEWDSGSTIHAQIDFRSSLPVIKLFYKV